MEKIQNPRWKKILNLQDMREFVDVCLKDPECKVVAIDSGSDIRQMAETEFCQENGLKRVYPIVLYGRVFAKIDEIIMRLHDAGKHFICTSRIKDEFEDDVRTGRRIRDSYKKFPYQLPLLIVLQRGIRDQAGRVWFDTHVFAEVYKNNFFKLYKEKVDDQITKPWLFDVSFEGLVNELVDHPWDEKNIIWSAHEFLHANKIKHDEKDTDKLKP